jgi:DNA polymerase III alpha subunit
MDIDIDIPKTVIPNKLWDVVPASMVENKELKKHLVGYYFQNIPMDEFTKLSAIPYKDAEAIGYTKIDFLHLNLLDKISSRKMIDEFLDKEPDWDLLSNKEIVENLFHIHKHFDILQKVKPKSVEMLADVLALIRPGKLKLLDKYIKDPVNIRKILYNKTLASDLRKSHAIAYALNIVLQLHLYGISNAS